MKKTAYLAFLVSVVSLSCEKKDPVIPNEEELITTLSYTLTPLNGGTSVTMTFSDLDGDGGMTPNVIGGTLAANTTYNGSLILLNESVSPSENITTEILEEGEDHQFFFEISTGLDAKVEYSDFDLNNEALGIISKFETGSPSQGTLKIILRHEPNKLATGVSDGLITNAGGETDIEIIFNVEIK
jgi:hypothetical protein